jgi:hypothetical protein
VLACVLPKALGEAPAQISEISSASLLGSRFTGCLWLKNQKDPNAG